MGNILTAKNRRFVIRLIAVLAWMTVIFLFSAQDAEHSSKTSGVVVEAVASHFVSGYKTMKPADQLSVRSILSLYIRKGAHFTEFMVLGILLAGWLKTFTRRLVPYTAAFCIGTLYAMSDEFHQHFSAGRSPQAFDILVDASGVLCGVLIAFLAARLIFRRYGLKS